MKALASKYSIPFLLAYSLASTVVTYRFGRSILLPTRMVIYASYAAYCLLGGVLMNFFKPPLNSFERIAACHIERDYTTIAPPVLDFANLKKVAVTARYFS